MIKETVFCDCCTREKKETNHWWQFHVDYQRDLCGHVLMDRPKVLIVRPYEMDLNRHTWQAACGVECLMKLVNSYIQEVFTKMVAA